MNYIEYTLRKPSAESSYEILIALLNEAGYTGFVETTEGFLVYLPEDEENTSLADIVNPYFPDGVNVVLQRRVVPEINWNAEWESNFHPITVDEKVIVRASFHQPDPSFKYDIVVNPKMSFGTGHHETTRLMIKALLEIDLFGMKVLDIGTGTGLLAILASKMGASEVTAIDIDKWAYENSMENLILNGCKSVRVLKGTIRDFPVGSFHLVLANINRNVLLDEMKEYVRFMTKDAILLLSGFYETDYDVIAESLNDEGLNIVQKFREKSWMAVMAKNKMS